MIERIVTGAFGIAFGGVGLCVLGFMWLSPADDFHTPPLFFRVFASLLAIPFVAVGGSALYAAVTGQLMTTKPVEHLHQFAQQIRASTHIEGSTNSSIPAKLACPQCGAPTGTADISPLGDVKCSHCQNWYNVR